MTYNIEESEFSGLDFYMCIFSQFLHRPGRQYISYTLALGILRFF